MKSFRVTQNLEDNIQGIQKRKTTIAFTIKKTCILFFRCCTFEKNCCKTLASRMIGTTDGSEKKRVSDISIVHLQ